MDIRNGRQDAAAALQGQQVKGQEAVVRQQASDGESLAAQPFV